MTKTVARILLPVAAATGLALSAAGIASAAPDPDPHTCPVQAQGMAGPCVTILQRALGVARVDGMFGPETKKAVVTYQQKHQIQVDGQAGPQVYNSLFPVGGRAIRR